ncbi:MAG: response regulator transcription factor [Bacteroidales bacterium]|nr:response regulator transcription factor [Bacteroidales bacterium]
MCSIVEEIKVLITDDHPIVRNGIKQILNDCSDINVVCDVSNGHELLNELKNITVDVILLDISMPGRNGLSYIKEIKNIKPEVAVLMLSIYSEEQYALRSLKLGASGYLTKSSTPDELITAIRRVAKGKKYITTILAEKIAMDVGNVHDKPAHNLLSDRELEVMCMLANGKSNSDIATELSLSPKTISTYRERILEKMDLKSTAEIIRYAIKESLVD